MSQIKGTVKVAASKSQLWDVVNDFPNISKASPGVLASRSTSDSATGLGATRHCDFPRGAKVEERIIEWAEGTYLKIDIYQTKNMPMMKNLIAEFEVTGDDEQSELVATMSYDIGGGRLGALANAAMMRSQMTKTWVGLMAGFKHRAETGADINQDTALDREAVAVQAT